MENTGADICIPPWHVSRMFCGIGQPTYKCCDEELQCKGLETPDGPQYACLPREQGGEMKRAAKSENQKEPKKVGSYNFDTSGTNC